jgi:hypothetical protein
MDMKPQNSKNAVESAVPKPPVEHLSESQKKALELSEQIEHTDGPERKQLSDAVTKLDPPKKPSGLQAP